MVQKISEIISEQLASLDAQYAVTKDNRYVARIQSVPVSVKEFGAVGDGVTDDTTAILNAKEEVIQNGGILYIPADMNCYVSGNIDLMGVRYLRIDGKITGASTTNEFIIGYNSQSALPTSYFINEVENLKVKVQGLKNADVKINFAPHVLLWADGDDTEITSIAYSRFYFGKIDKLEINSHGTNIGWINENKFYGGRFSEIIMDGNYSHNNNIFYNPTIENTTITITKGNFNYFYDCRFEGSVSITFGSGTTGNTFVKSYLSVAYAYLRGTVYPTVTNNGMDNYVVTNLDTFYKKETIFQLNSRSKNYELSNIIRNQYDLTIKNNWRTVFKTDFIELKNPIGFLIFSDQAIWRVRLYVYDENKDPITTEPQNFTSIIGGAFSSSGFYYNSANTNSRGIPVYPNGTVKYIQLEVLSGNTVANTVFNELNIIKVEEITKVTPIKILENYRKISHTAAPTEGYWETGDIVWNSRPTASGYVGWVCVTAGTPGTWKGFGLIEA